MSASIVVAGPVVHVVGHLGAVFRVLPPVKALAFIAVQQGPFGLYLGCSFAPNHKRMAILAADDRSDFLRRQVLTSRTIRHGLPYRGTGLIESYAQALRHLHTVGPAAGPVR